jgi:hypothetical protein
MAGSNKNLAVFQDVFPYHTPCIPCSTSNETDYGFMIWGLRLVIWNIPSVSSFPCGVRAAFRYLCARTQYRFACSRVWCVECCFYVLSAYLHILQAFYLLSKPNCDFCKIHVPTTADCHAFRSYHDLWAPTILRINSYSPFCSATSTSASSSWKMWASFHPAWCAVSTDQKCTGASTPNRLSYIC